MEDASRLRVARLINAERNTTSSLQRASWTAEENPLGGLCSFECASSCDFEEFAKVFARSEHEYLQHMLLRHHGADSRSSIALGLGPSQVLSTWSQESTGFG